MTCPLCNEAQQLEVFSTEQVQVLVHPRPAVSGHVLVIPREHYPILEAVPNEVMGELFVVANKISTALFEGLKAQGTNVLIQNGLPAGQSEPHVSLHVIPRFEKDGLDFSWNPQQKSEGDLDRIYETLKQSDAMDESLYEPEPQEEEVKEVEDWMTKHLERIP